MTSTPEQRPRSSSRRKFLQQTGIATAGLMTAAGPRARAASTRPAGANERIGIGFIGAGGRADNHMVGLAALRDAGENIELVAACDIYAPRLRARSERFKLKPYRTYPELLADPRVDAVVIASPDHHHARHAIDALRAGKDVYCEKPVTHWRQYDLTRELARTAASSKQVFMLGTQYMSDGAWTIARDLIRDGLIGRPLHAEVAYFRLGDWGERGMPIDDPHAKPGPDLDWDAFLGDAPRRDFDVSRFFRWRLYMDYAGGPATDLYPHFLTQVIYMLGVKLPNRVSGSGGKLRYRGAEREVPDTFSLIADYPEGLQLVMTGTQGSGYGGFVEYAGSTSPVIRGEKGALTFRGDEIVFLSGDAKARPDKRTHVPHHVDQTLYYREWLECIRTRQQPRSSAELAWHVQTSLQMAMLGWQAGKVATFDSAKEKIVLG